MENLVPQGIRILDMSIDELNALLSDYLEHARQRDGERRERFKNALNQINNPYYCSNAINGIPCYKCMKEVYGWSDMIRFCEKTKVELENHSIRTGVGIPFVLTDVQNRLILAAKRCITATYDEIKEARRKFRIAHDEYMDQQDTYREYIATRPRRYEDLIQEFVQKSLEKELKNFEARASAAAA